MPRGYGDLFPAGKRNQSRGVVLSTRAAQEECHYPVFLGDSEEATLQLADYLFPCPPVCVNPPGSKLSLGLAASIAGKQLHWHMRRSRRVPWELSQSSRILSAHVLKQHHCYGDLSNLGSKSYGELVAGISDKQRRQNMREATILVGSFVFAVAPNLKPFAAGVVAPEAPWKFLNTKNPMILTRSGLSWLRA